MKAVHTTVNGYDVCLSKGGKRQFFCNECGSGNIKYYKSDLDPTLKPRFHCKACGHHAEWTQRWSDRVIGDPVRKLELPDRSLDHLTYERNHEPDQQGIWFNYTGFRYKDYYDIELIDGTIIEECRPNGNGWYGNGQRDCQVKRIRLKPDDELDPRWHFQGEERINRNLEMFSENN